MYSIRNYNPKDSEDIKRICIETANGIFRKKMFERPLLDVYCRYYIEQEPESCFVVVDENDNAKGYILCAKNYEKYRKNFKEKYLKQKNPVTFFLGKFAMDEMRGVSKEYPAHLHIDLLPECQGQGFGRKMIELLISHLREQSTPGVMLDVGIDNVGAQVFYEKCGFEVLHVGKYDVLMGMKIK